MRNWTSIALLTAVWLIAIILVNPIGDFPLNDDWAYAKDVWHLSEKHQLKLDEWPAMTRLTQVFLGAGICTVFGFSFTLLRLSTLVLALGGLWATYQLCRELGQPNWTSLLATLTVAFNPLFFSLSFTFMTDVPFFAFGAMATLHYARALRSGKAKWVLWGSLFALLATFVRQQGLMFPLAFGVAWLFMGGLRPKTVAMAAWPLILNLILFLAFTKWLQATQGPSDAYGDFGLLLRRLNWGMVGRVPMRLGIIMAYMGLGLLPLSVLFAATRSAHPASTKTFLAKISVPLLFTGVLAVAIAAWGKLPWGNICYNLGLGPKLLKDGQFFLNIRPVLPDWALHTLKVLAFAAAFALLFTLKRYLPEKLRSRSVERPVLVFALANIGIYLGFLLFDQYCFDRYFFQLLPFFIICMLPEMPAKTSKKALVASLASLALMAAFSIAATHDYLAWNRARWQALANLTKEKNVLPSQIDGGFEFNGWHRPGPRDAGGGKSWWWVKDDEYIVTFGDLGGYRKQQAFPYERWLPPGVDSVFVLKRE